MQALTRRSFLAGLITAPAIVRIGSLMPVKQMLIELLTFRDFLSDGTYYYLSENGIYCQRQVSTFCFTRIVSWGDV